MAGAGAGARAASLLLFRLYSGAAGDGVRACAADDGAGDGGG
eukprot:CAMPEP_0174713808 /NCGR_PEP_ID=MMETSP1094-20130205/14788_1 /TAXON_ID=156173 /ORGANISM="Chrysochromulina brevifilum, Strain UTEX LB 985" /LENGTH=41 /DNA_ID= /DNA_START= /DNA_END= /DNA_ORIENTATION=